MLIFSLVLTFAIPVCKAQSFDRPPAHKLQKKGARKGPLKSKTINVREPRSVEKAKNEREALEKKNKRDYAEYVRNNQKRSIEIQTPEVRERMKQNFKNANDNYKTRKKNLATSNKKSGKKYR